MVWKTKVVYLNFVKKRSERNKKETCEWQSTEGKEQIKEAQK